MSRPEKLIPPSLEEAVAELKRDPSHPVQARVDGLDVELRVVPSNDAHPGVGSRLAAIGPWEASASKISSGSCVKVVSRVGVPPRPSCRDLAAVENWI